MQNVEFFFDFSCPYAYLAACRVRDVCSGAAQIELKPFLLGGVFNALEHQPMNAMAPAKARHNMLDMHRWASFHGVDLNVPSKHPMRTLLPLRMLLAIESEDRWWDWIEAVYRAYWVDGVDVTSTDVMAKLANGIGLDGATLVALAAGQSVKDQLRVRTEEAIERGVFGAPTFFVEGERFWGQDRLSFVADEIGGNWQWPDASRAGEGRTVEFFFDFSSPWAYLGSTRIEEVCRRHGAELVWRPMLLGAVFKAVGAPNVPLMAMPQPKQEQQGQDLHRFAESWDVPFQFRQEFPVKTVNALRLVLLAKDEAPGVTSALIHRLYQATWADDADVNDPVALAEWCNECGGESDWVERLGDADVKQALFDATDYAIESGVFGAPMTAVDGGDPFWGQDRLPLVEAVLSGQIEDVSL